MMTSSLPGHCGFDAAPFHPFKVTHFSVLPNFPYKDVFLSAKHHDDHHRHRSCNYALYFPLWDLVCGTHRPNSKKKVVPAVGLK